MRYLKIFKSKEEKEEAFQNGTLDKNSVTIYGEDIKTSCVCSFFFSGVNVKPKYTKLPPLTKLQKKRDI